MNRVVHFELGTEDPERAVKFYKDVFGWSVEKLPGPEPYWLVTTGDPKTPGINGGIMRHKDGQPRTVNTIAVQNVDEYAKKVLKGGGEIVVPKMAIPGVGWQIYCKDTEGIIFGLHQFDQGAV
jgi:predicted enzyme related to lactoylglutathione lyase